MVDGARAAAEEAVGGSAAAGLARAHLAPEALSRRQLELTEVLPVRALVVGGQLADGAVLLVLRERGSSLHQQLLARADAGVDVPG